MTIKMPKRPAPSPEAFVTGATAARPESAAPDLPWLDPKVQLNARLPERLLVQRDWLAHRLGLKK